ncbi:hypothetical protein B0H12DRAFT_157440 [Mycena haematopus]|nr:hypothetical protein B0H12DRAFT_157440 [Mycena haematopus]
MSLKSESSIKTRRRHSFISWRVENCNDPLSKLEIDSIRASVRDARGDLERIQRDLKRAQKTVQALSKEHNTTTKFIARELALLSPIRSLPREMLSEIMVHHSRMFAEHDRYMKASLVVSQVSTGWRSIAHATAVLWVRFPLYYCDDFMAKIPDLQIALYKTWLVRMGTLSCDVALRKAPASMKHRYYDDDDDDNDPPTYSLRPYYGDDRPLMKERWKMLDLEYVFDSSVTLNHIGPVQSLTVHIRNPSLIKSSELLVEKGPKLQELVFRCGEDMFNGPVLMPRLPLMTVKRCEMDRFPMTNGLQILQGAIALETLKWTTAYAGTESFAEMPIITSAIHTLDLSIWGLPDDALGPLFAHLTVPNLATLKILWMYQPKPDYECDASWYWDSTEFDAFVTRSAASLTSLTLLHAGLCENDLIALLEQTPLLVKFELSDRYARREWAETGLDQTLGSDLLARLLPSPIPAAPVLIPKLEVLNLRGGFEGNDIGDGDILHVFEARYPKQETGYVTRLSAGAFHLLRAADQQPAGQLSLAERAARLRKRGLKFEFTTLEPDPDDPDSSD